MCFILNLFIIIILGPKIFKLDNLRMWKITFISLISASGSALAVWLYIVPFQKENILAVMIAQTYHEKVSHREAQEAAAEAAKGRRSYNPLNLLQRKSQFSDDPESINRIFTTNPEDKGEFSQPAESRESRVSSQPGTKTNLQQLEKRETVKFQLPLNVKTTGAAAEDEERKKQHRIACKKAETISMLFTYIQNLSACFASFAHGGNDTTNAIAPLVTLHEIYKEGTILKESESFIPVLLYGSFGIVIGLWIWGRRVIKTIGNDLTKITIVSGFTVSFCAAFTVLLATEMGLPISSTHCVGGSVVAVGFINSKLARLSIGEDNAMSCMNADDFKIDWHLVRNMVYAWLVTVPITMLLSAGIYFCGFQLIF